jgi:hypothetical protein
LTPHPSSLTLIVCWVFGLTDRLVGKTVWFFKRLINF